MKGNSKIIITGVVSLAAIIGGYFLFKASRAKAIAKRAEKASAELAKIQAELPPELKESPDDYNPSSHVSQIADMIYGNNLILYPVEVNAIIAPLSDARTKKLAEAYRKEKGIGLYENLDGEWGWGSTYEASLGKVRRLGLTY
jgi:hypothetical protein